MDENDIVRQHRRNVGMGTVNGLFDAEQHVVYFPYDLFQKSDIAFFGTDRPLPVPLIDVERMDIVQLLVGADGVHVGIKPVARRDLVGAQLDPFPFGQRLHYFGPRTAHILDGKAHRPFHAAQVVVDPGTGKYEQGGGNAAQVQLFAQNTLESVLDLFDRLFLSLRNQTRTVIARKG